MDAFPIVAAAVGGGLGGAIGAFFARLAERRTLKRLIFIVPVVVGAQIGISLSHYPEFRSHFASRSRFELALQKHSMLLMQNPKFQEAIKNMTEAEIHTFTQEKTHAGLKRLTNPDLQEWNALRIKLAEVSPALCAGFWTGKGITAQSVEDALLKLSDEDMNRWIAIGMTASILEIENAPFNPVPQTALGNGLHTISSKLTEADVARMNKVMDQGVSANDEDSCWTMTQILKRAVEFQDPEREAFLRSLAAL